MALYRFRARSADGRELSGELEGADPQSVAAQLMERGVTPVEIVKSAVVDDIGERLSGWLQQKPPLNDLLLYARQMYTLTKAGVPITRGLRGLAESTEHPGLRRALQAMAKSLEAGRPLSSAMAEYPRVFSPLFISVVRVGEESGRLDEAHKRMFEYLSFEKTTTDRIKVALRYPIMVLAAVGIAIVILMWLVVPQFASVFARMGGELPWPTRLVMGVSAFTTQYWYQTLLGLALAVFALRSYIATPAGRYQWHRLSFRIPLVGSILLRAALARFARAFSMTYRSGVPLISALDLIAAAADNVFLASAIGRIREGAERGEPLTRSAMATGLFTPLVLQMLAVGEETGTVDQMMEEVANFYEREVDYAVDNLGAMIEPILMIAVGGVVLILALAVFLPMWDLGGLATGRKN